MLVEIDGQLFNPAYIIHVGKAEDIKRLYITTVEDDNEKCYIITYSTTAYLLEDYNKLKDYKK